MPILQDIPQNAVIETANCTTAGIHRGCTYYDTYSYTRGAIHLCRCQALTIQNLKARVSGFESPNPLPLCDASWLYCYVVTYRSGPEGGYRAGLVGPEGDWAPIGPYHKSIPEARLDCHLHHNHTGISTPFSIDPTIRYDLDDPSRPLTVTDPGNMPANQSERDPCHKP